MPGALGRQDYARRLDPQIRAFITATEAQDPGDSAAATAGIAAQRAAYDRMCAAFRAPRPAGLSVSELTLPQRPLPLR